MTDPLAQRHEEAAAIGASVKRLTSVAHVGLVAGLALFTALVAYHGVREITQRLASAGAGLLWIVVVHLAPLSASALGWHALLRPKTRLPFRTFVWARWIAESINQLLPALQLGGNLVRAQLVARCGVPGPLAGASVVVDITLHLMAQLLLTVLGLGLLLLHVGGRRLAGPVSSGLLLTAATVAGFYIVQRRGVFGAMARAVDRAVRLTPGRHSTTGGGPPQPSVGSAGWRRGSPTAAASYRGRETCSW